MGLRPSDLIGGYPNHTPYPLIDAGINGMVSRANPLFLWAAVFVFPLTYLITSYRWDILLTVLDIRMKLARAFVLNMVGVFLQHVHAGLDRRRSAQGVLRIETDAASSRAVMSVLVDRIIGLLALMHARRCVGGDAMARGKVPEGGDRVGAYFRCTGIGLLVLYTPILRRMSGPGFHHQTLADAEARTGGDGDDGNLSPPAAHSRCGR